jgi:hypothetical protein
VAQTTVQDAHSPQEIVAAGIKSSPAASADNVGQENPAAGVLPVQVVVKKGDSLGKVITHYYPGQERLGLEAAVLANPEISREDVLYPGQTLNLPRIHVSAQVVQLQDQLFYALYGRYYSAASWEGDQPWLEKHQVRFLVRKTQEFTGRVVHRIFLGGYETVADLQEAQGRLLTKRSRAWQERDPDSPVVTGSTAGQEEAVDGAALAGGGHRTPNPAPAGERQPDPGSPGSSAALEVKGAARPEAREMAAGQAPLEPRFEDGHPQAPFMQFIANLKNTPAVAWIIRLGQNIFGSWRYLISTAGSGQNLPLGNFLAEGNAVGRETSLTVPSEPLPPENGGAGRPEPKPEGGSALSPPPLRALHAKSEAMVNALLSRYREILGVLLVNKVCHFPEHLLQSVASKEEPEPLKPLPEPDSPEKVLLTGTIRRYWDACGVLHIVNGELSEPDLGLAAFLAARLKDGQPSEWEQPERSLLMRNVSWPGLDYGPDLADRC